jgi:hypothetical protein
MTDFLPLLLALLSGVSGLTLAGFGVRVLVHEANTHAWRRSLTAFELRIPHSATPDDIARWLGLVSRNSLHFTLW